MKHDDEVSASATYALQDTPGLMQLTKSHLQEAITFSTRVSVFGWLSVFSLCDLKAQWCKQASSNRMQSCHQDHPFGSMGTECPGGSESSRVKNSYALSKRYIQFEEILLVIHNRLHMQEHAEGFSPVL